MSEVLKEFDLEKDIYKEIQKGRQIRRMSQELETMQRTLQPSPRTSVADYLFSSESFRAFVQEKANQKNWDSINTLYKLAAAECSLMSKEDLDKTAYEHANYLVLQGEWDQATYFLKIYMPKAGGEYKGPLSQLGRRILRFRGRMMMYLKNPTESHFKLLPPKAKALVKFLKEKEPLPERMTDETGMDEESLGKVLNELIGHLELVEKSRAKRARPMISASPLGSDYSLFVNKLLRK